MQTSSFYYPEGPLGPICDAIIPDDVYRAQFEDDDDLDTDDVPTQVIDGPRDPNEYVNWPLETRCKVDPETGELYDCETIYDRDPNTFDLGIYDGINTIFNPGGEPYPWARKSTAAFGLQDDFFIPVISPKSCVPFEADYNIRPVTYYDQAGNSTTKYACENSTPVTFAVDAISTPVGGAEVAFSDDGLSIVVGGNGSGEVSLTYEWDDSPSISGVVLSTIEIVDGAGNTITWTQSGEEGAETRTIQVSAGDTYPITYNGLASNDGIRYVDESTLEFDDDPPTTPSSGGTFPITISAPGDNGRGPDAAVKSVSNDTIKFTDATFQMDTDAELKIKSTDSGVSASFSGSDETDLELNITGSGTVRLEFSWDDDPNSNGKSVGELYINGQTIDQSGDEGEEDIEINTGGGGGSFDVNSTFKISGTNLPPEAKSKWNDDGSNFGVWTNNAECTLPCLPQTVNYQFDIPATDTYFIQFGADNEGELYLDGSTIPLFDVKGGIIRGQTPFMTSQVLTAGTHTLEVQCTNGYFVVESLVDRYFDTNPDWCTLSNLSGTAIREALDGFGNETNAITATFTAADTLTIGGSGIGEVKLAFEWDDNPNTYGQALGTINVTDSSNNIVATFTQTQGDGSGNASATFDVTAGDVFTLVLVNNLQPPVLDSAERIGYLDNDGSDFNAELRIRSVNVFNTRNEVGGFDLPDGSQTGKYLSFGTLDQTPTTVTNRTATLSNVDLRGCERIFMSVIAGDDDNGGERPNDPNESLEINVNSQGWQTLVPSRRATQITFAEYDGAHGEWHDVEIGVAERSRIENATIELRQTVNGAPEINGLYNGLTQAQFAAQYANSGDVYGIEKITFQYNENTVCFSLYEHPIPSVRYRVAQANYYDKDIGQWAHSNNGFAKEFWNDDTEYFEGDVTMTGGSGTGMILRIRVEAWPQPYLKTSGRPGNARYKIIRVVNPGSGYQTGDTLGFEFNTPRRISLGLPNTQLDPLPIRIRSIVGQETACSCIAERSYLWSDNPGGWFVKICRGGPCIGPIDEINGWVRSGPHPKWSDFMNDYAVYPSNYDVLAGTNHVVNYNIVLDGTGAYTLEYQGDNIINIEWDGTAVVTNGGGFTGNPQSVTINSTAGSHTLRMGIENTPTDTNNWTSNPAGGAWKLTAPIAGLTATWVQGNNNTLYLQIAGNGFAQLELDFEWDDNPNTDGTALGTVRVNGKSFVQGSSTSGTDSKTIDIEGGRSYPVTITGNSGGYSVQNNGTRLCFYDNDGTDCNAQLDIGAILGKVIRTSADLSFATGGNITWHTRLATGYKYQDTPCE